jgi:hypothetical protein
MATKKVRRRRPQRHINVDRIPEVAESHEPWAANTIARTANMVFGGAEVLTVGMLRLTSRLVTSTLTGVIAVGTQAGVLAVDAVRDAIGDATDVARAVAARAETPGRGRAPAGTRRRLTTRRLELRRPQPVTQLSQPAA